MLRIKRGEALPTTTASAVGGERAGDRHARTTPSSIEMSDDQSSPHETRPPAGRGMAVTLTATKSKSPSFIGNEY